MFRPNQTCSVCTNAGKTDVYGRPTGSTWVTEQCAVVKLNVKSEKTAVRSNTSATQGNARELETDAILLMTKNTAVKIDGLVNIYGNQLRVIGVFQRHDAKGVFDHVQVALNYWNAQ